MPPSPIPAPLPAWAKFILNYGLPAVGGYLYELLTHTGDAAETDEWRRLHCVFTRTTPTGTSEDKAICTFDIVNVTGGAIDNSWTTGDYTTCEGHLDTMWTGIAARMAPNHTLTQYRWYRRQFTPEGITDPMFLDSGPPLRVTTKAIVGTGAADYLPYQVALTVTERTAFPKHWGRFYIPGLTGSNVDAYGRFTSTAYSNIGSTVVTAYAALAAAQFFPVVPVTQVDKVATKALLGVNQIVVDDLPDVQRSRRPKQSLARFGPNP